MKKILLSLAVASLAAVFASCGGNKQAVVVDVMPYLPCKEESYDKAGEYLAGYGISSGYSQSDALLNANRDAIREIMSRFTGGANPEQKIYINQNAVVVCRKIILLENGEYECHVVVHVKDNEIFHSGNSKQTVGDSEIK